MKFVDVEPLPDELAHSVIARLAFQNCCDSDTLIAKLAGFYGMPKKENYFSVVAQALGYQNSEFLNRHTMYRLAHAFDRGSHFVNLGARTTGFRTFFGPRSNTAAWFCRCCSSTDLPGNSAMFWRRAHHLPSVDWCPTHFCGLESFPTTFTEYPCWDARVVGQPTQLSEGAVHAANPTLRRYGALLALWKEKSTPYRSRDVCDLIISACVRKGLGMSKVKQRLLSDALAESLPRSWLVKFMPKLSNKVEGEVYGAFDQYQIRSFANLTVKSGALLLAFLFTSVEAIERELNVAAR